MAWDYDKAEFDKQAVADPRWRLERAVQYGPEHPGERLDGGLLKAHLPELKIPEDRRAFLELILWGKPF